MLAYLRASGFKTYIVSGGGDRVHAAVDRTGLWRSTRAGGGLIDQDTIRDPPRQARTVPSAEVNFVDDKAGKPVGIKQVMAGARCRLGNSDGDLEMLQWTTMSGGVRFGLLVHHSDADREYAYDRNTPSAA